MVPWTETGGLSGRSFLRWQRHSLIISESCVRIECEVVPSSLTKILLFIIESSHSTRKIRRAGCTGKWKKKGRQRVRGGVIYFETNNFGNRCQCHLGFVVLQMIAICT